MSTVGKKPLGTMIGDLKIDTAAVTGFCLYFK